MRITKSTPEMPLGAYPQDLLWGQVGSEPTRNNTSITSNTVERVIGVLLWLKSNSFLPVQINTTRTNALWGEHLISQTRAST